MFICVRLNGDFVKRLAGVPIYALSITSFDDCRYDVWCGFVDSDPTDLKIESYLNWDLDSESGDKGGGLIWTDLKDRGDLYTSLPLSLIYLSNSLAISRLCSSCRVLISLSRSKYLFCKPWQNWDFVRLETFINSSCSVWSFTLDDERGTKD